MLTYMSVLTHLPQSSMENSIYSFVEVLPVVPIFEKCTILFCLIDYENSFRISIWCGIVLYHTKSILPILDPRFDTEYSRFIQ